MNIRMHRLSGWATGLYLVLGVTSVALADDVTDQINEALKAYESKDLSTASTALELAQNLIRQSSADVWKTMLPEPLAGWAASTAESTSAGAAMFGGGISVTRKYTKGADNVEISLITDSPMMQGLGALLSSGMITSNDMKLLVVDGRKVTYTKSENSYQTMVAKKVLVKVEGSKGIDERTLRGYLAAVRFKQIESHIQ